MTRAEQIAAGLTAEQRWALNLLSDTWQAGPRLHRVVLDNLRALGGAGLVDRDFLDDTPARFTTDVESTSVRLSACWHFRLTPLGLEVRAILNQENRGADDK